MGVMASSDSIEFFCLFDTMFIHADEGALPD